MATPDDRGKRDVLDLLYEDGDESALAPADRDELAKWREVRGAMRALPEAEPARSIDVLMAAARTHADARAPRGLWGKLRAWFAVMAAHPAMSAAATVVLVGGVAGALYVSGRVGHDTETVSESASAERSGANMPGNAPILLPPPAQTQSIEKDETPPVATIPDVEIPAETHDSPALKVEKKVAPAKPEHHIVVPARPTPAPAAGGAVEPREEIATDDLAKEDQGEANGVVGGQGGAPAPAPAADKAPAPPPPPPPSPAPAAAPPPAATGTIANKPSADPAALTRQAKAAAKRKDCKTVDALANRVIEIDLGYYRANFAPDPEIRSNCDAATRK